MNGARAYARTQTQTASRERLMVLLFEAALKHMRAGAAALEQGQQVEANAALTRASDIVLELSASLDARQAPELGEALRSLYLFVNARLMKAAAARDVGAAREAERVFAPLAEAFAGAVAQVAPAPAAQ